MLPDTHVIGVDTVEDGSSGVMSVLSIHDMLVFKLLRGAAVDGASLKQALESAKAVGRGAVDGAVLGRALESAKIGGRGRQGFVAVSRRAQDVLNVGQGGGGGDDVGDELDERVQCELERGIKAANVDANLRQVTETMKTT
jgi:hypothetical protein